MAKKSAPPAAPAAVETPKAELPAVPGAARQIPFVSMVQVPGGWVVVSIVVDGDRVVERTVHSDHPYLKEYAAKLMVLVMAKKVIHPNAPAVINLD